MLTQAAAIDYCFGMQISVFVGVSIDGFLARDDGTFDFLTPFEGEEHGYSAFFASVDTLVIGRATYDTVIDFPEWPYRGKRVVVVTHRPLVTPRNGETSYRGGLATLCAQLAADGARRVYLDGGATIRQALDADLVDDMTISTVPRTIGRGRPLFGSGAPTTAKWQLTAVQSFASGIVQARWQRERE